MILLALLTTNSALADGVDEIAAALTQPLSIQLDPATWSPEKETVRSFSIPMSDGLELQIHVAVQEHDLAALLEGPIELDLAGAPVWEGRLDEDFVSVAPDALSLENHLRAPDLTVTCNDRYLQTYVSSDVGANLSIAAAIGGGSFGALAAGAMECKLWIIEWGDWSYSTWCPPDPCDLGGGASGICGPTVLSQCACTRDRDPNDKPPKLPDGYWPPPSPPPPPKPPILPPWLWPWGWPFVR